MDDDPLKSDLCP